MKPGIRFTDDPALAARYRDLRGKTLPQIGRIEIAVIEEDVTRLLEFDLGRLDYVPLRGEIANRLLSDRRLKPEYASRGIGCFELAEPYLFCVYLNLADPVIGGMTNERVALRGAIAAAFDVDTRVKGFFAGLAIPAGPRQVAASRRMSEIARTYVPLIPTVFRLENDFVQPWLQGFSPQTLQTYWKSMDIDLARREKAQER